MSLRNQIISNFPEIAITDENGNILGLTAQSVSANSLSYGNTFFSIVDEENIIWNPQGADGSLARGAIATANTYPELLAYGSNANHGGPQLTWINSDNPNDSGGGANSSVLDNHIGITGDGFFVSLNENFTANIFRGNLVLYAANGVLKTPGDIWIDNTGIGDTNHSVTASGNLTISPVTNAFSQQSTGYNLNLNASPSGNSGTAGPAGNVVIGSSQTQSVNLGTNTRVTGTLTTSNNVSVTGTITATGTVTGGSVSSSGNVSAGGNVIASGDLLAMNVGATVAYTYTGSISSSSGCIPFSSAGTQQANLSYNTSGLKLQNATFAPAFSDVTYFQYYELTPIDTAVYSVTAEINTSGVDRNYLTVQIQKFDGGSATPPTFHTVTSVTPSDNNKALVSATIPLTVFQGFFVNINTATTVPFIQPSRIIITRIR